MGVEDWAWIVGFAGALILQSVLNVRRDKRREDQWFDKYVAVDNKNLDLDRRVRVIEKRMRID